MLKCKAFILTPSKLTRTRRNVFLSHPTQASSSIQTFSSLYRNTFKLARPHGRFLSYRIGHTDLLVHADSFFPLPRPLQTNLSTRIFSFHWRSPYRLSPPQKKFFFPLPWLTQTNLSTRTFYFHWHNWHKITRQHRYFVANTGLAKFCPRGHLEITHLPSPHRFQSYPQVHLEAPWLPTHTRLTPVHKDI